MKKGGMMKGGRGWGGEARLIYKFDCLVPRQSCQVTQRHVKNRAATPCSCQAMLVQQCGQPWFHHAIISPWVAGCRYMYISICSVSGTRRGPRGDPSRPMDDMLPTSTVRRHVVAGTRTPRQALVGWECLGAPRQGGGSTRPDAI